MKMRMDLKTLLEAAGILFDKKYVLERVYSKEDDVVEITYIIKEDGKNILDIEMVGPYENFSDLIDFINTFTIEKFKHAVSRN